LAFAFVFARVLALVFLLSFPKGICFTRTATTASAARIEGARLQPCHNHHRDVRALAPEAELLATTTNSKNVTFGSRALIVFIRVSQVIFLLFFISFGPNGEPLPFYLYGLCIVGIVEAVMSTMVYGALNDDDLGFMRWRKVHQFAGLR
jgi:hypothetical protein